MKSAGFGKNACVINAIDTMGYTFKLVPILYTIYIYKGCRFITYTTTTYTTTTYTTTTYNTTTYTTTTYTTTTYTTCMSSYL